MREDAFAKGRRYVTEARLRVLRVDPDRIEAICRGSGAVYYPNWSDGSWFCDCPARTLCCHLVALQLVTVAPSPTAWRDPVTKPRPNEPNAFEARN